MNAIVFISRRNICSYFSICKNAKISDNYLNYLNSKKNRQTLHLDIAYLLISYFWIYCFFRAPRYVVKNQIKAYPCDANADYKHQKLVRVSSAKRQMNTHPEPRTSSLLPLRPKSCRPSVRTTQMEIDELYAVPTPKVSWCIIIWSLFFKLCCCYIEFFFALSYGFSQLINTHQKIIDSKS